MKLLSNTIKYILLGFLPFLIADLAWAANPSISSPSSGSTLSGSTVTFSWAKNGTTVNDWWLNVGPSAGSDAIHSSGNLSSGTLSRSVSGLPTNGSTVWVRLYWKTSSGGSWQSRDYQYTASGSGGGGSGSPGISSPSPSSILSGSTVTFSWTKNGTTVTNWWLYVGPSTGSKTFHDSGSLSGGTLSRSVSGLPTNGSAVWVRLYWRTSSSGAWQSRDFQYTAGGSGGSGSGSFPPTISSPSPGSTLTSTSVTFTGNHTSQDLEHWLYIGTSTGAKNLHDSGSMGTGHTKTVSNLPTSGTIHVRYWTRNSSGWQTKDHTYTMNTGGSGTGGGSFPPSISSPSPGTTLTSSSVTFTGNHTSQDLEHWLYIGTSTGAKNLHDSGSMGTGHTKTVSNLPTSGTIHVRYWTRNSSGWQTKDHTYTMNTGGSGTGGGSSGSGFYVSTTGNNNNAGTQASPFRTIRFGIAKLAPGKTLFVRGGTYWESISTSSGTIPSGTSWSSPVKIVAYNGEQVNVKGKINIGIFTKYMIFDGINIDAINQAHGIAVNSGSHHIRFKNLEVKNPNINGIELSPYNGGSHHIEFINLNIHHTAKTGGGHGIYITTTNNLIESCDVHDNPKFGIHVFNGFTAASNSNIVRNNTVYRNGVGGFGGMTIGGDGNLVSGNLVYENFKGISIGSGNAKNTTVTGNTVRNNTYAGIKDTGTNTTITNNTAFGNNPDYD